MSTIEVMYELIDRIAGLEARDLRANAAHEAVIAVAHPARIVGRSGYRLSPFVVAPVGADLQRRDFSFHPNFIRRQVSRIQFTLLDAQISRTSKNGDLHGVTFTTQPEVASQ